jgi:hypothetical protein
MQMSRQFILYFLCTSFLSAGINWRTLHSSNDKLSIAVNFDIPEGIKPEPLTLLIGLPASELPELSVRSFNKRKMGFTDDSEPGGVKWINQQKVRQLETATLEIHPRAEDNYYYRNFIIDITFGTKPAKIIKPNKTQRSF